MISLLSAGLCSGGAAIDDPHDVGFLHDHQFLAVEASLCARSLAEQHAVTRFEVERMDLAVLASGTWPDGDDISLHRFSWAVSGMMIPPVVFASCSTRRITTRSCKGLDFMRI
jgi:hypothetical protein